MSAWKLTASQRRRFRLRLKRCRDAREYRRLLAVVEVDGGQPAARVASRLGVSRQSVQNWLRACREQGVPDVLEDRPREGRPSIWDDSLRELLCRWMAQSPERHGYRAAHWTAPLLREQFRHARGEELSEDALRREIHRLGYA